MSAEKNAEIWSTRLQKELLAITTENASEKETQEVAGILPPFIKVKGHELDIGAGTCKVTFVIDVKAPAKPVAAEAETPAATEATEGGDDAAAETTPVVKDDEICITLDASLTKNKDSSSIDTSKGAYPFEPPKATLTAGAGCFPEGSTITNGSAVDIDCDWTPSLHLTDAVLNVGLKIKECILQAEPFHPALVVENKTDAVDVLANNARRFGAFIGKSARTLVDQAPSGATRASKPKAPPRKKATSAAEIAIGDEINVLDAPWVDCKGLYSCKAIRRPAFVEDAMVLAASVAKSSEPEVSNNDDTAVDDGPVPEDFGAFAGSLGKVAGSGFAGAAGMFRSFTQSAKSVLEESFLMITETHIIELRSSKLNLSQGTVTFAIAIELMAKLKFRRQESISLFFKPAPEDPLIFMCPDSADAVQQIQSVLKGHGVKGKHSNSATQKAIHEALQLVQEIQAKERALEYQPSVERVNEIMDLYRQAAELFELAGDIRHEEVVTHMRKFLAMPLTSSVLDGSFKPEEHDAEKNAGGGAVPEGEVLARTKEQVDDDGSRSRSASKNEADAAFSDNLDNVLKEAKEDLDKFAEGLDGDLGEDGTGDDDLDDLDAMLATADAELADIMSS